MGSLQRDLRRWVRFNETFAQHRAVYQDKSAVYQDKSVRSTGTFTLTRAVYRDIYTGHKTGQPKRDDYIKL